MTAYRHHPLSHHTEQEHREIAQRAVDRILVDFSERARIGDLFRRLDGEIYDEVVEAMRAIIIEEIERP